MIPTPSATLATFRCAWNAFAAGVNQSAALPSGALGTLATKRILIAEDDPKIAELIGRALQREFVVVCAADGAEALAKATREPPDLLLTDVMMPLMDGFHLARQVRLLPGLQRLPIVFLTADDRPSSQIHGIRLGARHFISKPFVVKDLIERVRAILGP
ncbi:MAG: hypothetical protein RJA70_4772 [Pseudomonadota bacterium]